MPKTRRRSRLTFSNGMLLDQPEVDQMEILNPIIDAVELSGKSHCAGRTRGAPVRNKPWYIPATVVVSPDLSSGCFQVIHIETHHVHPPQQSQQYMNPRLSALHLIHRFQSGKGAPRDAHPVPR